LRGEFCTNKPDKARFWPCLEPFSVPESLNPLEVFLSRWWAPPARTGASPPYCIRVWDLGVNSEQIRQPRPDSGLGLSHFQRKGLKNFLSCSLLAAGHVRHARVPHHHTASGRIGFHTLTHSHSHTHAHSHTSVLAHSHTHIRSHSTLAGHAVEEGGHVRHVRVSHHHAAFGRID